MVKILPKANHLYYTGYDQEEEDFETSFEAIGPYDTQEEAMLAGEESARRMRGQGYFVEDMYAVSREDGLWDVVVEYQVRVEPIDEFKEESWLSKYGLYLIGGVAAVGVLGVVTWSVAK